MKVFVLLTVLFLHQTYCFNKLPAFIQPCSKSDPKFNECAIKSGKAAIPFIVEGDSTYHIPTFKPFKLDYVSLEASENIKLYANDVQVTGFDGADLKDFNWDFENKIVNVKFFLPFINILGTYNMHGRILIMNLRGSGPMNNSHYDNDIDVKCAYSLKTIDNTEYIHLDKADISIKILKGVNFHFGNLLNNTQLSDQMNSFLNENWKVLIEDLYPSVNKILSTIALSLINPIAAKIPYEDIVIP